MLVGLAVGLGGSIPLARGAGSQFIGIEEIREGMKGYGLTTLHGSEPEKFDAEVMSVLHNTHPGEDLILVKTSHPRLDITKDVKGMSGSPIYFDGRLAGAYSWGFSSFGSEPVIGVTPIALMVTELHRPIPPGFWPLEGGGPIQTQPAMPVASQETRPGAEGSHGAHASLHVGAPKPSLMTFEGAPGEYDLAAHARQLASRMGHVSDPMGHMVRASTPMMLGGVSDRAASALKGIFEPIGLDLVQAGGGTGAPSGPMHFAGGSGLGVPLGSGDISFTAIGTATYVEGSKIAGFGHPMFGAGASALPTCIAKTNWVWASDLFSFKLGECVRPLGALVQDRQSAIILDETKAAPAFPMDMKVIGAIGAPKTQWHVDLADDRFIAPGLAATVLSSVVEATTSERRDITWTLHSKVSVRNHGTLDLDDYGVSTAGTPDVPEWFQTKIIRVVGEVLNNPWEQSGIDKVESTLTVKYTRELWTLRGVELLDPVVDAGEEVRIRLRLLPFAGDEVVREISVHLPASVAGKDVELEIAPGYLIAPDAASPENLSDLLVTELHATLDPKSIIVQYKIPQQGVAFRGHVASQLPSFALDALRPTTTDDGPENFATYVRASFPMENYIDGRDKVKVHVRAVVR